MLQQLSARILQPEVNVPLVSLKPRKTPPPVGQLALPAVGAITGTNAISSK